MKCSFGLLGVIVGVSAGLTAGQGPFRENLIADNGAELDVNLEETVPVDNTVTTRISPFWVLAPELEAVGYAIGSRGTSGRFGSDFTIPFRGQAHFTIVNQSNPDPRAVNGSGLGAMHQTFDLLALGFTEEELDAGDVLVAFGGFFAGWRSQGDSIQVLVQGRSDDANFNILDQPEDDLGSTATTNFCIQAWTANGAMGSDGSESNWWGITNQGLGEPKLFRTRIGDGRNLVLTGRFPGDTTPTTFDGGVWIADSDVDLGQDFDMDESLITRSVDLSGFEQAQFTVHSGLRHNDNQVTDIDVSVDGGQTWDFIWFREDGDGDTCDNCIFDELLDDTDYEVPFAGIADGQADVQIRFHFYGTEGADGMSSHDNWLWVIDDVRITAVPSGGGPREDLLNETFDSPDLPLGWEIVDGGDPNDGRGVLRSFYYSTVALEEGQEPVSVEREITIVEQEVDVNCFKDQPGEEPIFETLPVVTEVDGQPILTQWTFGDGSTVNILRDQPMIFKPGALVPLATPASLESGNGIRFLRFTLIGVREGGGDSDGYIDETYMRLVQGEDVPSTDPQLVQVMDGLGGVNPDTGLADRFISPLGENVPFDTVDFDLTADVEFASPIPGFTLTSNGGGNHTLTSDAAVPVGTCLPLSFDVRDLTTGVVSTISFTVCHLPLDVNQDGTVNIQDITAWGAEFNGARRAALTDTNGDGNVNVQDATAVGDNWFGRPPATKPWNGESLP